MLHLTVCGADSLVSSPLEDMKAAYYGYSVVESRVWVNEVIGIDVNIN